MTVHIPVMLDECLEGLNLKPGGVYVDGTMGGGGHSSEILKRIGPEGTLIALDRDGGAVEDTEARLRPIADEHQVKLYCLNHNYADTPEIIQELGIKAIDGILLDLGLSSDQLEDRERGFSFNSEGPLDLRFNRMAGEPASRLVNRLGEKHLADIIYQFGEERFSRRVARNIVKHRHGNPIETAAQLAEVVRRSVPKSKGHSIDPATRTFQALRIAVNEELKWLNVIMRRIPEILSEGGRAVIMSFHSLEDRIVKEAFQESLHLNILVKKPMRAGEEEVERNPRSRSAKLRIAEKKTR